MTLKIFGIARSRAFRNIWLSEELGLDYEVIDIAPTDAHQDERLRALNPNARIPAIEDEDGTVIWESIAINLYLAGKHRGELSADDAAEYGRILQWSFWGVTECEPNALEALRHRMLWPEERRVEAKAVEALAALERPFATLNSYLEGRDYLAADRFTVADLNVASILGWAKAAGMDLAPYPNLKAWLSRCTSRPAARKATSLMR
ncbi:MAG: glutathione S-transferase family protein [Alphaproteobacteria bacterium]|nr:glutathione S-transferase family protein [Alphaproteobacteria bacterium]